MTARGISDRERFVALCLTGPTLVADAVVVLCGEDCEPRLQVGAELYRQNVLRYPKTRLVVTGGKHLPPRWMGAQAAYDRLLALGVAPDRIDVDAAAEHTRDQATYLVKLATDNNWRRLFLVASAYHLLRATLTCIKALDDAGLADTVQLVPFPAPGFWRDAPEGMDATRLELLATDLGKIHAYHEHVATPARGIAYLQAWEGR